jgi:hypothetical protein
MGLRQEIRRHSKIILTDATTGFAWSIVVTDPDGKSACIRGFTTDIADLIDPETGMGVSGRQAEVTLHMDSLKAVGLEHPAHIASGAGKPWTIKFDDIEGKPHTFKVMRTAPDRAVGVILCYLEAYVA